jgi:GT2 family glycosyltransferase
MLSIVVPVRNARHRASWALQSTADSLRVLGIAPLCEFVVIDDASEPECDMMSLVAEFRRAVPEMKVTGFRLRTRRHYTYAVALGMSVARGDVLMISHDMFVTPSYVRTLLAVAAMHPDAGVVRGTSGSVDCFPQHIVAPPVQLNGPAELIRFSGFVADHFGLAFTEDEFLIGDSMLILRRAIDRIGVMDTSFVGFMGDVDYGLRVRRARLSLLCAKGAWLNHEGSGLVKSEAASGRRDAASIERTHAEMVGTAYAVFRSKWDETLPDTVNPAQIPYGRLCEVRRPAAYDVVPALAVDSGAVEII